MSDKIERHGLVLLTGGEYADSFQIGVFRAEQDIDLDVLAAQFAAELDRIDPEFEHHRLSSLVERSDVMPSGSDGSYDPGAVLFSKWLVDGGLISKLPVATAHLQTATHLDRHNAFARVTVLDQGDDPSPPAP